MRPKYDPETGCVVPEAGNWPVDPQEDQELQDDRLWIDGCFDFFHHGHAGVMLQSRRLGKELYVGLHSDEDIRANKGPTVMTLAERIAAVDACRFSTKCVPRAPYVTSIPWISHYGCKFVVHGDDITSDASGNDCYRFVKKAGRMKIVSRTPGISTTDLVGRMLLCTKSHFIKNLTDAMAGREGRGSEDERLANGQMMMARMKDYAAASNGLDRLVEIFSFKPKHRPVERRRSSVRGTLSRTDSDAGEARRSHDSCRGTFDKMVDGVPPRPGQRIVYVDGGFDLFSSGHIAFLQTVALAEEALGTERGWFTPEAQAQRIADTGSDYGPTYVIAGVHDDDTINYHKGLNYPIMNIFERGLCVVQCAYIHGVVFNAPHVPNKSYLSSLPFITSSTRIPDAVYHGRTAGMPSVHNTDPYADAKTMELFVETLPHRFQNVSSAHIVQRILDNRQQYEERQRKKAGKAGNEQEMHKLEKDEQKMQLELKRQESLKMVERQFGA